MPHRVTSLAATILVAALTQAATFASHAPLPPQPGVDILVNGAPLTRYPARGHTYVEALKGEDYDIRLRNPYSVRVAVALSVDGLNTIDARETSATDARKWVLAPYETITIRGWQTSQTHARRFHFTTEERSYGQALGRTGNLGIITAVFFRERTPEPMRYTSRRFPAAPSSEASPSPADANRAGQGAREGQTALPVAAADDYAATGIGRQTRHEVDVVSLDLEAAPAASVSIRYEFREQLVRLGVVPPRHTDEDPLARRERARGFAPGFCPDPKR